MNYIYSATTNSFYPLEMKRITLKLTHGKMMLLKLMSKCILSFPDYRRKENPYRWRKWFSCMVRNSTTNT